MDKQFDALSKSLAAEGVSRREALRKLGIGLAGVLLASFGLSGRAAAGSSPACWYCEGKKGIPAGYVCSTNRPSCGPGCQCTRTACANCTNHDGSTFCVGCVDK